MAIEGPLDKDIHGITNDSRRVEESYLFVAIKGSKYNGHNFIPMAQARGAVAIVHEGRLSEVRKEPGIAYIQVEDTQSALSLLAARFYSYPSQHLPLIGITGTNGKTTITYLLGSILEAAGYKTGIVGTIAYRWGKEVRPASLTTPDALELQSIMRQMLENGIDYGILEVSSHALKVKRVDGCSFRVAIFTNLTRDHLDFHGTMEDYFYSKRRLFHELNPDWAIINQDDPWGELLLAHHPRPGALLTYGLGSSSERAPDIRAEQISCSMDGLSCLVQTPAGPIPIISSLTGKHNIYNILASVGAALCLSISVEYIQQGVRNLKGVPGRFEKIGLGQDFAVVVDYAHSPDALENTLRGAKELTNNRLITVFGCGGDRDRTKRPVMGKVAACYSQITIITSDNPRSEDPLRIIAEIEKGFKSATQVKDRVRRPDPTLRESAGFPDPANQGGFLPSYEIVPERKAAIYRAISLARSGDIVVIAGKGHETYQIFGDRMIPFDDREIAKAALQERLDGRLIAK